MHPILIVEDEKAIANLIELTLRQIDLCCVQAHSGKEAADLLETQRFDLALLDVMLPDIDGFGLMEYIRPTGTPVIFLTARNEVRDKVRGLELGAYDYIVKPFAAEELIARVEGVLRHTGRRTLLHVLDIEIDPGARSVQRGGVPIELTPHEYDLLLTLVHNRGIVLYRSVLFERVWGADADPSNRTLDTHISRLRRKLGWDRQIRTVPRVGYILEVDKT